MSDSVCVAVDACCDLPHEFLTRNNIRILPFYTRFGDKVLIDDRDPGKTLDFYKQGVLAKSFDAESTPVSAQEMSNILEKELVLNFDKVLAITMMSSRSKFYENIREAVWVSQPKFKELRSAEGLERRFRIMVMDSNNLFTGPGVLVYEAVRLLKEENASIEHVMLKLEPLTHRVRTFILPQDLFHLKNRAGNRGDKSDNSLNWFTYQVGKTMNIKPIIEGYQGKTTAVDKVFGFTSGLEKIFGNAIKAIDDGLGINAVTMSYAGALSEIQKEHAYQEFITYAKDRGVPTFLAMMSTTAAINVGPGCFVLSYTE